MSAQERVLAVAAHADDETLGGGALAMHADQGAQLCILILSASVGSRPDADQAATAAHRARCARGVAALYGAELRLEDLPDNRFDTVDLLDVTRRVEDVVNSFAPTIVYTHWHADLSRDHQLVAQATGAATRPVPGAPVRTVLAYEVRSSTDPPPTGHRTVSGPPGSSHAPPTRSTPRWARSPCTTRRCGPGHTAGHTAPCAPSLKNAVPASAPTLPRHSKSSDT